MLATAVLRLELASEAHPAELVKTDCWAPPPGSDSGPLSRNLRTCTSNRLQGWLLPLFENRWAEDSGF